MTENSYATTRKIKIIEARLGSAWRDTYPEKAVDWVYNLVLGDERKNLFCKITETTKEHLDEMTRFYDTRMSELIEQIIEDEYDRYIARKSKNLKEVAEDFSGH